MFRRLYSLFLTVPSCILLAGCCSTPRREAAYIPPPPAPCDRCNPIATPRYFPAPVPAAVGTPAPGAVFAPPAGTPAVPDGSVVQGRFSPTPPAQSNPPAQEPTVRLSPPELAIAAPPETKEPPVAAQPPAVTERREPPASPPIDIPQFAQARSKVANGLQPFPDGVAWLRDHGYRTVLHVRVPGTDDAAARRQFEKYGLRYLALETDPKSLSKETVDYFNRLVSDESSLPMFVYDKDGSLTGGLWYLHYRLIEGWSDAKARAEATRLGFRQEQDDSHRTMWIAVQKLLEANGR